jgi:hypothetical protein
MRMWRSSRRMRLRFHRPKVRELRFLISHIPPFDNDPGSIVARKRAMPRTSFLITPGSKSSIIFRWGNFLAAGASKTPEIHDCAT